MTVNRTLIQALAGGCPKSYYHVMCEGGTTEAIP